MAASYVVEFMTACYDIAFIGTSFVVEFYDRVLWYWVLWPRAMLSSQFM